MSCANLVNKSGKALTDCKAVSSQVKVKAIPIDQLKTFMSENKKFEEQCYKRAMMYLVNIFSQLAPYLSKMEEIQLNEFVQDSEYLSSKDLQVGRMLTFPNGGYVFQGKVATQYEAS